MIAEVNGTEQSAELYTPPVIDLDQVRDEADLLPLIKQILVSHDTFLLQNYANVEAMQQLVAGVMEQEPDRTRELDASFSGYVSRGSYNVEQWLRDSDSDLTQKSAGMCMSRDMERLRGMLVKIGVYFAALCVESMPGRAAGPVVEEGSFSSLLCRYHSQYGEKLLDMEFDYFDTEWVDFQSVGVVTVVPDARWVKVPHNESWCGITLENCILIHTGDLLARLSNGMHSTSKIRMTTNSMALNLHPKMSYRMENGELFSTCLLESQMGMFPEYGEQFYPAEFNLLKLKQNVKFMKSLFSNMESMINLYKISHPGIDFVELETLLPSISRMLGKKISTTDFQRLLYIWPNAYSIDINSNSGISLRLHTELSITKSRLLQFVENLDKWFEGVRNSSSDIPDNIPILKLGKRKASNSASNYSAPLLKNSNRRKVAQLKGSYVRRGDMDIDLPNEDTSKNDSLLARIRDKERRAAALLSQRQLLQEQFLAVKMKKVFEICFTLEPERPYTEEYLTGLIVDSLTDTNNPIGRDESVLVLSKLSDLLGQDVFQIITVEGKLKVYKWKELDQSMIESSMHK